ncbi:F-box only protein 4, partial [Hoplias malabaricus]|uniref:F-box only protein 4 n=1 Tax=Hoplias malabaricus TaxID=27720 RepID=UPI003462239E
MRSVLVRSLRSVREKLLSEAQTQDEEQEEDRAALLDHLPVDLQVVILSYLAPADLCRLGGCSRFWRAMVQEPLLWRYFFLRDVSLWSSVDHLSLPRGEFLSATPAEPHGLDFMAEYIRCSPASRTVFQLSRPALDSVAYFLQNLVSWSEPRFSMFGPGLEQLDVSLMTTMMHSPHTLPIAGIPHRHIG